jgi:hypothetical protein
VPSILEESGLPNAHFVELSSEQMAKPGFHECRDLFFLGHNNRWDNGSANSAKNSREIAEI